MAVAVVVVLEEVEGREQVGEENLDVSFSLGLLGLKQSKIEDGRVRVDERLLRVEIMDGHGVWRLQHGTWPRLFRCRERALVTPCAECTRNASGRKHNRNCAETTLCM